MRSYLLGTLDESTALSVEQRYFTDRHFFLFVQAAETTLIVDYLAGRLEPESRALFESRYLLIPHLKLRLEEIRSDVSQGDTARQAAVRSRRAMLILGLGGVAATLYWFSR